MRTLKLLAASIVVLALLAVPRIGHAQGLMVSGYADFEAFVINPNGSGNSDFYFDNHHFNLILSGALMTNLIAAAEIEYEHAGEEIAVEYAYIGYTGFKNVRIMAGKFILPFGRFNKDLHPTWINKMIDRPHGFKDVFPQTYSDVGLWVTGAAPMPNGNRFAYDFFVVNGLMGPDGGGIRGMRDNDREKRTGARDDNKAIGGRLGFELGPAGLDFGTSVYFGNYSDDEATGKLNLVLFGADVAYRNSGFELRGEVISASQDATAGDLTKTGGYVQAAYLVTPKFEPVVRYSARNMPTDAQDNSRFSIGVNFYVSSSAAVRINYHFNGEKSGLESDNNVLATQFTIGF